MDALTRRQFLSGLGLAPLLCGTAASGGVPMVSRELRAEPWPEAEALFHREPRWMGGDSVYSVDIGGERILWLFGDSFIATSPANRRSESRMVRNCVAVQSGHDPATASMEFYWKGTASAPEAFFTAQDPDKWLWPAHAVRIGSILLMFFMENRKFSGGLGFAETGWSAAAVDNPDASPDRWHVRPLDSPNRWSLVVGSAVFVDGEHLYAYAHSMDPDHSIFLSRFTVRDAAAGRLGEPEWHDGPGGWVRQSRMVHAPEPVMLHGQTEFNVYRGGRRAPWLAVQTDVFGAAGLAYRTASRPSGVWSEPRRFFRPPEADRSNILIYSAKIHPMLAKSTAELVVSYSTNSLDFATLVNDTSLYYPRFVRARWS